MSGGELGLWGFDACLALAQRPRSDFRRIKKLLCLYRYASHQPYPGLQGQRPPAHLVGEPRGKPVGQCIHRRDHLRKSVRTLNSIAIPSPPISKPALDSS
jgi:hypothetical protein